jgi:nucleoside 2-deoxyribosyltransferase
MKIYLAGSMFTTGEQEFNRQIRDALTKLGHEVWLPQVKEPREKTAIAIFNMDVEGIDWCEVVVANMDGGDPDSGTSWECGYAFRKKPIITYRTDFRKAGDVDDTPFNLMMSESADEVLLLPLASVDEVAKEVSKAMVMLAKQ